MAVSKQQGVKRLDGQAVGRVGLRRMSGVLTTFWEIVDEVEAERLGKWVGVPPVPFAARGISPRG